MASPAARRLEGEETGMSEAPSPFIADTRLQYAWDSTSLGYLKKCPRLYQYAIIEGYRSKGADIHLTFGSHYHASLEHYDKCRIIEGMNAEDAFASAVRYALTESFGWDSDDTAKNRENLIRSIIWYLDEFGEDDPAKTIELKSGKAAVELSFRMEVDFAPSSIQWGPEPSGNLEVKPYILCGHLDRLVTYGNETFVMDRKTTGTTLSPHYFENYDLDNQMSLYSIAARTLFDSPVRGVIIDAAQIAVGFTRFGRGVTYRSPDQLDEWLRDAEHHIRQAEGYAIEGYWPMNDAACFGCRFRRVCSKAPSVRDITLKSDFVVKHWNPLTPR